jgi:hypothetical protein
MPWNQSLFDASVRKKYEILGQNADSDTTRANATAQDVAQRPGMQAAADAAAMERARLASQTQLGAEQIRGGFGLQERTLVNQGAANVAGIQGNYGLQERTLANQGSLAVAGLGLEGDKLRTQAMMQPQYGAIPNKDYDPREKGSVPYWQYAQNQAAMDRAPGLPGGLSMGTSVGGLPGGGGLVAPPAQAQAPAVGGLPGGSSIAPTAAPSKTVSRSDRIGDFDYGARLGGGLPGQNVPLPTVRTPQEALQDSRKNRRSYW